jgi:hypothetical protein
MPRCPLLAARRLTWVGVCRHGSAMDAEVQQRAVEYFALASRGPAMSDIVAEMPKFPERAVSTPRRAPAAATRCLLAPGDWLALRPAGCRGWGP